VNQVTALRDAYIIISTLSNAAACGVVLPPFLIGLIFQGFVDQVLSTQAMSFFRSGASNTPPPPASYNRIPPDGSDYSLPRSARRPPPPSAQYNPPQNPYNDPTNSFFEKPNYSRKAPPRSGGRQVLLTIEICFSDLWVPFDSFGIANSPSDALALTNCLIVHPSDFPQGQHVLINGTYALTVR